MVGVAGIVYAPPTSFLHPRGFLEMGKGKKKAGRAGMQAAARKRREKKGERKKLKEKPEKVVKKGAAASFTVQDYMAKVEEYLDTFQLDMAIKFCEKALQLEPSSLYVLDTMAPLLLEAGEMDRAYELFQKAVTLSPDEGHAKYLYLGQLSSGEEAIAHLTKGIEILNKQQEGACQVGGASGAEELSSAYCTLAEVYLTDVCFQSEAGDCCSQCCTKAIELAPDNPEGYQLMASCLLSQELPDKAREVMVKGLSIWLPSCREKGEGQVGGASASVGPEDESDRFPSYSSRVGVAKLLLELEEFDLAHEVLEGLLREDDEVVGVWYLMGWLHCLTKDADSARFYLQQTEDLYTKLCCDEEEILAHTSQLLKELQETTPAEGEGEEGEGEEGGEEVQTDSEDDDMDVS